MEYKLLGVYPIEIYLQHALSDQLKKEWYICVYDLFAAHYESHHAGTYIPLLPQVVD